MSHFIPISSKRIVLKEQLMKKIRIEKILTNKTYLMNKNQNKLKSGGMKE